jgi:isochorismate synthase
MPARLKFNPAGYKQQGHSFALYKLPASAAVQAIVCAQPLVFSYQQIEHGQTGFAFVPFDKGDAVFLLGDVLENVDTSAQTSLNDYYLAEEQLPLETEAGYVANVTKGVAAINKGGMDKVVLGRNTALATPQEFCPLQFFTTLCSQYPEAFVSLVSINGIGTWIGATPESLLKVTQDKLTTVALAGTQLKDKAQWSEKESEEQLWVVRYIEEILNEYQATQVDVAARRKIQNGPLEHLYTEISFKKEGVDNTKLAAAILPRLHPTPAVCGLPKQTAMQFILANENYRRSYYAGFLGPVNCGGQTNVFVNLRCMQITQTGIVAYAGAGITKDSVPEMELTETQNKLNNLKKFL